MRGAPASPEADSHSRTAIYVAEAIVLLGGFAIGGYLIGSSSSSTSEEAREARLSTFRQSKTKSQAASFHRATARGSRAGVKAGTASAARRGRAQGVENGAAAVEGELALIAAAEAEAEAQERAENCGAPLFTEGYCPTDAEIEQESQAEAEADFP